MEKAEYNCNSYHRKSLFLICKNIIKRKYKEQQLFGKMTSNRSMAFKEKEMQWIK